MLGEPVKTDERDIVYQERGQHVESVPPSKGGAPSLSAAWYAWRIRASARSHAALNRLGM